MAIITKEEVKTFLQMSEDDTSKDAIIDALIPEVEGWLKTYLNNPMKDEDGKDSYPKGIKMPFSQLINFDINYRNVGVGVSQETLADYTVKYDDKNTNGYPMKILELFNPFIISDKSVVFL